MSDLNRREFVVVAAAVTCGCLLSDVACAQPVTAGTTRPSTTSGPTSVDVGAKADYVKDGVTDKFAKSNRVLVIRNDSRLYAPTATCTHKNCAVKTREGEIVCPCHGSRYSIQGTPTKGPAKGSLFRYAISINDKDRIIVDKTRQFDEKHWDDPAAFIKLA